MPMKRKIAFTPQRFHPSALFTVRGARSVIVRRPITFEPRRTQSRSVVKDGGWWNVHTTTAGKHQCMAIRLRCSGHYWLDIDR